MHQQRIEGHTPYVGNQAWMREKRNTAICFLLTPALVARHWLARSASSESYGTYLTLIPERDSSGSARLTLVIPSYWMSGTDSVWYSRSTHAQNSGLITEMCLRLRPIAMPVARIFCVVTVTDCQVPETLRTPFGRRFRRWFPVWLAAAFGGLICRSCRWTGTVLRKRLGWRSFGVSGRWYRASEVIQHRPLACRESVWELHSHCAVSFV